MAEMHKPLLLVALLVAQLATSCSDAASLVRMQLTRPDAAAARGQMTQREMLQRMALRSKAHAARFRRPGSSSQVMPGNGEYRVMLAIGTPPQPVELTLDTGSDLTWTQCGSPCPSCYAQPLPHFYPPGSSTFSNVRCKSPFCQDLELSSCGTEESLWGNGNQTCVYTYSYVDQSVTTGILGVDTFTFASGKDRAALPGLAFGCGLFNNGLFTFNGTGTGVAGFGRGPLSLPSQLKVDNFSYCFTPMTGSKPSPVLLGLPAKLYSSSARGAVQTTPLIQNPANNHYYLSLKGISVGSTRLPVPESAFALTKNGTGGTVIDSGTGITRLPPNIYRHLRHAFVSQAKLPVTNDDPLCFAVAPEQKPDVPKLALHFEGATLDLPREDYVLDVDDDKGRKNICIMIIKGGDEMTIIGNYQQQNMHILYDLAGNKLSFVPARCDRI